MSDQNLLLRRRATVERESPDIPWSPGQVHWSLILLFLGGLRWDVVKRRTLGGANWVDAKVLNTMGFVRRQIDRLPPHRERSAAAR